MIYIHHRNDSNKDELKLTLIFRSILYYMKKPVVTGNELPRTPCLNRRCLCRMKEMICDMSGLLRVGCVILHYMLSNRAGTRQLPVWGQLDGQPGVDLEFDQTNQNLNAI